MQERDRRMMNMYYTTLRVVLYQIPQGAKRPRYRICRKNLVSSAIANPDFIHVYSPDAAANHNYMRKIVNQQEIIQLEHLICTPCDVHYRAFFPTPSSYSKQEIFMAEIGLIRPLVKPDFDNIEKLYADMYNSNVWIDDALTVDATIGKYYSILPRVEIDLGYLNAVYCKQQYNNIISRKDYDTSMRLTYI
jgi:Holliday junction resolvase RusA-like endonuclease